jgi:hypothetical protein
MPYQWIDPELFLEFEGVAVYHCYDDGSMISRYWYTTDVTDCNYKFPETDTAQFDVRDLPNLGLDAGDQRNHAPIIRHAISQGLICGEAAVRTEPPLIVKIVVLGGMVYVVEKPPGVEVEITDYDVDEEGELPE